MLNELKSEATDEVTDSSSFVDIDEDFKTENLVPSSIARDLAPQKLGPPSNCEEFLFLEDIAQNESEQSLKQAGVSEENFPEKLPATDGSGDLQSSKMVEHSSRKVQNTHFLQQSEGPAVADDDSRSTDEATNADASETST